MIRNISSQRCLILGGGGFIGVNLCLRLLQLGVEVHGVGRSEPAGIWLDGCARWTQLDFQDTTALARIIEGYELIYHLVGGSLPQGSNKNPASDITNAVVPTLKFLDLYTASPTAKIVFASSGGTVYGVSRNIPIKETAPTEPITSYGITKLTIERYLALYEYLHGIKYTVLRIANPFGPFQFPQRGQGLIGVIIRRALAREPLEIWGSTDIVRDYIYVDDVTDALIRVAGYDGPERVFNIGTGIGRSIDQVISAVENALWPVKISTRYLPGRQADVPANVLDIERARYELGWQPATGFEEGVSRTIAWLRART